MGFQVLEFRMYRGGYSVGNIEILGNFEGIGEG